jgi:hypothetical protein
MDGQGVFAVYSTSLTPPSPSTRRTSVILPKDSEKNVVYSSWSAHSACLDGENTARRSIQPESAASRTARNPSVSFSNTCPGASCTGRRSPALPRSLSSSGGRQRRLDRRSVTHGRTGAVVRRARRYTRAGASTESRTSSGVSTRGDGSAHFAIVCIRQVSGNASVSVTSIICAPAVRTVQTFIGAWHASSSRSSMLSKKYWDRQSGVMRRSHPRRGRGTPPPRIRGDEIARFANPPNLQLKICDCQFSIPGQKTRPSGASLNRVRFNHGCTRVTHPRASPPTLPTADTAHPPPPAPRRPLAPRRPSSCDPTSPPGRPALGASYPAHLRQP